MGLANLALVRVLAEPAQVGAAVDLVRVRVTVRVEVRPRARIEVKVGRRGRPCPSASRRWSSTWPRRPPSLGDAGRYREIWGDTGRYGRARGLATVNPTVTVTLTLTLTSGSREVYGLGAIGRGGAEAVLDAALD